DVMKDFRIMFAVGFTCTLLTALYAVFTFFAPLIQASVGDNPEIRDWYLVLYGVGGVIGNWAGGLPGLIRSMPIPSLSHQTDSFDRLKSAFGEAKGTPLSVRMALGRPFSRNTRSKTVKALISFVDSSASTANR